METKFQTSFIPRKPLQASASGVGNVPAPRSERGMGGSIFMTIAVIIFVLSLAAIGGAIAWKQYLLSAQVGYEKELAIREKQYNLDLIKQLKAESVKLTLAKQLLSNHFATSKIFGVISSITAQNVRFQSMDLQGPTETTGASFDLSLAGYGRDLTTVAFQSQVMNELDKYGLRSVVKNPIISDPGLNQNGSVTFRLSATVEPTSMLYQPAAQ